jgi:lactoylglutathione lyase
VTLDRAEGFVFVELYVPDPAYYVRLFHGALGFDVVRDEGDFVELRSSRGLILLNRFDDPDPGHPFEHYRRGPCGLGVEIGIFSDDLEASWQKARLVEGCQVSAIVRQEWGMTDYRILTPHGYYLRITTPG